MKATRTVEIKMQSGVVTLDIEITRELREEIAYADGHNVPLGKKAHEDTKITINHNGKNVDIAYKVPAVIRNQDKNRYPATAYATLGRKVILTETNYNIVMQAVNEATAEIEATTDTEYAEVKAAEVAAIATQKVNDKKAAEKYATAIKNGMCPKCGTWCYGDCTAH